MLFGLYRKKNEVHTLFAGLQAWVEQTDADKKGQAAQLLTQKVEKFAEDGKLVWGEQSAQFVDAQQQEYADLLASKYANARETQIKLLAKDYVKKREDGSPEGSLPHIVTAAAELAKAKTVFGHWGMALCNFSPARKPIQVWDFEGARLKICELRIPMPYLNGYVSFKDKGGPLIPEDCSLLYMANVHGAWFGNGITYNDPATKENGWVTTYGFDTLHYGDLHTIIRPNDLTVDGQIAKSVGRELETHERLEELKHLFSGGKPAGIFTKPQQLERMEKETMQLASQLVKIRELVPLYKQNPDAAEVEFMVWQEQYKFPDHIKPLQKPNSDELGPDFDVL